MAALRWFYSQDVAGDFAGLDAIDSHHVLNVIRLRPGDRVRLFDGRGNIAEAVLTDRAAVGGNPKKKSAIAIFSIESRTAAPTPSRPLALIVSACKGARHDFLIEKCTELGASELWFTNYERSVVRIDDGAIAKWRRTALEACKQCRRATLPEFRAFASLVAAADYLGMAANHRQILLYLADPDGPSADEPAPPPAGTLIAVCVGPEGGLTEVERSLLLSRGARPLRLAQHILRVETAAIAVAARWAHHG